MIFEIISIVLILIILWIFLEISKRSTAPPGPFPILFLGTLPQMALADPISYLGLDKLAKKYGDLMSVKLGLIDAVVVSSYETAKEICAREETLGRQCNGIWWDRNLKQNIGLGFCSGGPWVESRKFCRDALRDYGFGNREAMENLVMDELTECIKHLDEHRKESPGGCIRFTDNYFHKSFANVMASMIMGKRFDYDDPELLNFLGHNHNFIKNGILGAGLLTAYPFLKNVIPKTLGYDTQIGAAFGIQEVAQHLLDRRRKGDYIHNPRCFADDFLKKMDEEAGNPNSFFTEDSFKIIFSDLMQGGTDTTGNFLAFLLLLLSVYPEVQEKLFNEINEICGVDSYPRLEQKSLMIYTQAVLLEGFRWSRVLVNGIPKMILNDFKFRGYHFKKEWILILNYQSIFFDEKFWEDPNIFRPERFLDEFGNLIPSKTERIVAFGLGKRNCFGEVLARDSSFLFLTSLIQKFKFELPIGEKPNLEPLLGITLGPHPFNAIVTRRHS